MIKINLALRKQAAALDAREKGGMKALRIDSEALKSALADAQVRKLALTLLVAVLGTYLLNGYENDQLNHVDQQIQQANAEQTKLRLAFAKTSGYDALKRQFDADEQLIKTKLSTIQNLVADRQVPPKILASIVGIIPKNLWITEMSLSGSDLTLKGSSLGFDDITAFMKSLGDSEYLQDLKLENTEKAKSPEGLDVATFEIEARRK